MAFRAPVRGGEATHIFPRGEGGRGGVILGGCRQKDDWDGRVDHDFAEVIKARCCALVPELGRPEDLRVIKHGVGLRRMHMRPLKANDILTTSSVQRRRCSH